MTTPLSGTASCGPREGVTRRRQTSRGLRRPLFLADAERPVPCVRAAGVHAHDPLPVREHALRYVGFDEAISACRACSEITDPVNDATGFLDVDRVALRFRRGIDFEL